MEKFGEHLNNLSHSAKAASDIGAAQIEKQLLEKMAEAHMKIIEEVLRMWLNREPTAKDFKQISNVAESLYKHKLYFGKVFLGYINSSYDRYSDSPRFSITFEPGKYSFLKNT